jgi:biopolymer transport protein TolR
VAPLEVIIKADASLALRDSAKGGAEQAVTRDDLAVRIKAAQTANPQQAVLIAGDRSVKYEVVLSVMDELQRQQVGRIGLLVQPVATPGVIR